MFEKLTKKMSRYSKIVWVVLVATIGACSNTGSDLSVDAAPATDASRAALERLTGELLENFSFELSDEKSTKDWYQVSVNNNQVKVTASSRSALTYGAYAYLNDIGALSVSWEGSRVAIPETYVNFEGENTQSPFWQRVYLNVCAYGYTMPWWDWTRWEKEVDWMAAHGINTPVAMEGQEIVWQKLWKEFSITDTELTDYFSGPAFTAWHRMGNIEAHMGPLPQSWIDQKYELQVKMLKRMRELGMDPVVPAFGGYVPKQFAEKYPDAKIYKMPPWTGFKEETYWLDPADPLFAKVAKRFIEIYSELYGKNHYYLSDSFNEMLPPVSEDNRYEDLAAYGEAIFQSINQADPDAVWVMQGWMFGADKEFWDLKSVEAFLSHVPNNRAMIHDIANDRYEVWEGANAFYGKPWIFGYIHNYGGSNPVYGDFKFYQQQVGELLAKDNTGNLSGFGVFPEGIHSNSVVYEFLYDLAWSGQTDSLPDWLKRYTNARYGKTSAALMDAWSLLDAAVFETKYWSPRWWEGAAGGYLLFKRPETKIVNFSDHPGDLEKLGNAVDALLAMSDEYTDSPLYLYDLVDFYRHYLTIRIDLLLREAVTAYQQQDIAKGDKVFVKVTQLTEGLDLLLGLQQESLSTWLDDAKRYGTTPAESLHYVKNAKMQVTVWGGPKLKDYASKAWQGMYKDFYLPRWSQFFVELKKSVATNQPFNEAQVIEDITAWEVDWVEQDVTYEKQIPENPIELMKSLLKAL